MHQIKRWTTINVAERTALMGINITQSRRTFKLNPTSAGFPVKNKRKDVHLPTLSPVCPLPTKLVVIYLVFTFLLWNRGKVLKSLI